MASAAPRLKTAAGASGGFARRAQAFGARALPAAALLALGACSVIPIPIPLPGRGPGPAPIADRAIDLDGACVQTEEDGFRENAQLSVRD
ncbi:MAG: hypothetical protein DCC72_12685, partial [Burkholderiales bacterium]